MAVASETSGAAAPKGKKRISKAEKKRSKRAATEPADEDSGAEGATASDPLSSPRPVSAGDVAAAVGGDKRRRRGEAEAGAQDVEDDEPRGVIYIGHIPAGFFEPQMKKFFGQFGTVTRLRVARSRRNAASKGYAFVEFEQESVAKIVAETMQKYLLFEKTLVCHVVPKEKQHPALFKGWSKPMRNRTKERIRSAQIQYNERPNVEVDGEMIPQTTTRQVARRKHQDKKLQEVLKLYEVSLDEDAEDGKVPEKPTGPAKKKRKKGISKATIEDAPQADEDLEESQARPLKKMKKSKQHNTSG